MPFTGLIYDWILVQNRIHGRMEEHASRPELNGKDCHTSAIVTITTNRGDRIATTASGSRYKLVG